MDEVSNEDFCEASSLLSFGRLLRVEMGATPISPSRQAGFGQKQTFELGDLPQQHA
jgi:hypothetical protein